MSVVNFAALPPEVNSGLMYSGSGSGPMVSAATAWDRLAAELGSAATSYREVISELTDGGWQGPSAEAMAAAAAPYVEWMNITAAQAAQTASQARSAAAAYEAAFTATVPPPVIAANRALLSSLVSTNTFGQNTAAIAANQAQYAEMWAQDVTAMYSYVGNAAAAVQLTPFSAAPQDTNPAAAGAPAAAASQATGTSTSTATQSLGSWLHSIGSSGPLQSLTNLLTGYPFNELETINGTTEGFSFAFAGTGFNIVGGMFDIVPGVNTALTQGLTGMEAFNGAMAAAGVGLTSDVSGLPAGALSSTLAGSYGPVSAAGGASVSAGLGRAAEVGALSVPQSWASASDIRLAAKALPAAGLAGLPQVGAAAPGLAGMGGLGGAPILGSVVDASRTGESGSRYGVPSKLLSGLPGKTGAADQSVDPAMRSSGGAVGGEQSVTEYDELGELRRIAAELAKERDELKRSANALIKRVTATRQLGP